MHASNPGIRATVRRAVARLRRLAGRQGLAGCAADVEIPQASTTDSSLKVCESRDWRELFSRRLSGSGLEIGPLHRPMVRHDGMDVRYIDRCTVDELRKQYPELKDLPLVEPDIIGDAETMSGIEDASYDFLVSAHVIEHTRNPLAALKQWCRIVRPGGLIYLIVPDKRFTFDARRVRTTLEHMILDYQEPSADRDFEHYLDYSIHVLGTQGHSAIAQAKQLQKTDYSIHFHVFQPGDIVQLLEWCDAHVTPLATVEGPVMSPGNDEFHLLLRVPTST